MNKPHSFRKKPVIIEAVQYTCTADNLREITDWARSCNNQAVRIDTETRNRSAEHPEGFDYPVLKIETLEGVMQASVGDWIIKGVNGEFYPCKPDIFEKTYDTAEESLPHQGRVIDEKAELDERREKLVAFKNSKMFHALPWQEQERLNSQAHLMTMLSAILGERIALFEPFGEKQ
jgi:hypothetical protein